MSDYMVIDMNTGEVELYPTSVVAINIACQQMGIAGLYYRGMIKAFNDLRSTGEAVVYDRYMIKKAVFV